MDLIKDTPLVLESRKRWNWNKKPSARRYPNPTPPYYEACALSLCPTAVLQPWSLDPMVILSVKVLWAYLPARPRRSDERGQKPSWCFFSNHDTTGWSAENPVWQVKRFTARALTVQWTFVLDHSRIACIARVDSINKIHRETGAVSIDNNFFIWTMATY